MQARGVIVRRAGDLRRRQIPSEPTVKSDLRTRMRSLLRKLTPAERAARSTAAAKHLVASAAWRDARVVLVFLSLPSEVDTTALVEAAWGSGKRVLAPRVDVASTTLVPVAIRSWSDCLPGFKGILEPTASGAVPVESIDLVLVPGLAFDLQGRRLGRGGGYYDRFLARPGLAALTCGLGFESQVLDQVPSEAHDRRVDALATDKRFRRCGSR